MFYRKLSDVIKTIIFIAHILFVVKSSNVFAVAEHIALGNPPLSANFTGIFHKRPNSTDSLLIFFFRDEIDHSGIPSEISLTKSLRFWCTPDENGRFHFTIPNIDHPGKLQMYLLGQDSLGKKTVTGKSYEYIVSRGDNLSMDLNFIDSNNVLKVDFEGRGVEKYNCINELGIQEDRNNNTIFEYINPSIIATKGGMLDEIKTKDIYFANTYFKLYTDNFKQLEKILSKYKREIPAGILDLTKSDAFARTFNYFNMQLRSMMEDDRYSPEFVKEMIEYYRSIRTPDLNLRTSKDSITAAHSHSYVDYLLNREQTSLFFENEGKPYRFKQLFDRVEKLGYSGLLKEKLITLCILSPYMQRNTNFDSLGYDSCLNASLSIVKTPYLKQSINTALVFQRGRPAFKFEFADPAGQIVRLSDFRGKVILQDTWFTGCYGCARFYTFFKKDVYPLFKDNPNFVWVSINSDRDKNKWLASIKSGKYCSEDEVNLFSGGLGDLSPIEQYYNANVAPLLIVIDKKGNIYSRIYDNNTAPEIIETIKHALAMEN